MQDPIDHTSPLFHQNRRKILKWVFLLLQQHHERLGLKVMAWSGPEGLGIPRLSFFFDRLRQSDGRPVYHFPLGGETVEMHTYQWEVGVFQPLNNGPQLHTKQSQVDLRTTEMVPWLNEQLRITPLYVSLDPKLLPYTSPDSQWKGRSERYLHSWNVLGLYLRRLKQYVRLESLGSTAVHEKLAEDVDRFSGECRPEDILVFPMHHHERQLFWLHTGRLVRRDGESLDFFQLTRGGMPLDAVIQRVVEFMGDPKAFAESM